MLAVFEKEKVILEQMVLDGEVTAAFYHDRLKFHEQELNNIGTILSEESEQPGNQPHTTQGPLLKEITQTIIQHHREELKREEQPYENQLEWPEQEPESRHF